MFLLFYFEGFVDLFKMVIMAFVAFVVPVIAIIWVIYSLVRNRSNSNSITDWKDTDLK